MGMQVGGSNFHKAIEGLKAIADNLATKAKTAFTDVEIKILKQFTNVSWATNKASLLSLEKEIKVLEKSIKGTVPDAGVKKVVEKMTTACETLRKDSKGKYNTAINSLEATLKPIGMAAEMTKAMHEGAKTHLEKQEKREARVKAYEHAEAGLVEKRYHPEVKKGGVVVPQGLEEALGKIHPEIDKGLEIQKFNRWVLPDNIQHEISVVIAGAKADPVINQEIERHKGRFEKVLNFLRSSADSKVLEKAGKLDEVKFYADRKKPVLEALEVIERAYGNKSMPHSMVLHIKVIRDHFQRIDDRLLREPVAGFKENRAAMGRQLHGEALIRERTERNPENDIGYAKVPKGFEKLYSGSVANRKEQDQARTNVTNRTRGEYQRDTSDDMDAASLSAIDTGEAETQSVIKFTRKAVAKLVHLAHEKYELEESLGQHRGPVSRENQRLSQLAKEDISTMSRKEAKEHFKEMFGLIEKGLIQKEHAQMNADGKYLLIDREKEDLWTAYNDAIDLYEKL